MTDEMQDLKRHGLGRWLFGRGLTKLVDAAILGVVGLIGLALSGLLLPTAERVQAIWNSPATMSNILTTLDSLTGADKVTQQPRGLSYVREPVRKGDPIVFVLFIGRTQSGAGCRLLEFTPLFTGENQVVYPGTTRRPSQQIGPQVVRREIQLRVPEMLPTGRVGLRIQLHYECGGQKVFENTEFVFFQLLEAAK
jgi:hypothetical protein